MALEYFESVPLLPAALIPDGPGTPKLAQKLQGLETAAISDTRAIALGSTGRTIELTAEPLDVLRFWAGRRGQLLPFWQVAEPLTAAWIAALGGQTAAPFAVVSAGTATRALRLPLDSNSTLASLNAAAGLTAGERLHVLKLCRFATDTLDVPTTTGPTTFSIEIKELE